MEEKLKETIENSKCPKCGGKLVGVDGDSITGLKCSKCGEWAIVTTHFPDYHYDETKYTISLLPKESFTKEQMSFISKKCQCNYIDIKQKLSKEKMKCISGVATELKDVIIDLNKLDIKYEIEPKFKYVF